MTVDILTSGIWQTNTTILSRAGVCVVVDPAYFPRELDAIVARVREIGRAEAVVFTHGHWDHVMGHSVFPGTPVWVSQALAQSVASGAAAAAQYLADAREFDSRWYVPRPAGHRWPDALQGLGDGERAEIGGIRMRALHLPGHSPDGLGLIVEGQQPVVKVWRGTETGEAPGGQGATTENTGCIRRRSNAAPRDASPVECSQTFTTGCQGLLLVGDYLSPCEIPFVDDVEAYRATLVRLMAIVAGEVGDVIPGHGRRLTAGEAADIARADLDYLDRLAAAGACGDVAAARAIPLPRAADVAGMRDHHRENCAAAGLVI